MTGNNKSGYKALIVGSSQEYLLSIRKLLREMQMFERCSIAFSGIEALAKIEEENPNLLITDIVLRGLDGLGLLEEVRASGNTHCKIIVCTSVESDFIIRKSFAFGADYFVIKPYCAQRLQTIIQNLLREQKTPYYDYKERVELMIFGLMQRIGLPPGTKGYQCAGSAIKRVLEDETLLDKMTSVLYPALAEEFQSTPLRVERNIRHAIEVAWKKGDLAYIEEMFGYTIDAEKGKPTTMAFLATVIDYLKRNLFCVESSF